MPKNKVSIKTIREIRFYGNVFVKEPILQLLPAIQFQFFFQNQNLANAVRTNQHLTFVLYDLQVEPYTHWMTFESPCTYLSIDY
ncbi:Uncharacterised protein [Chlamydia trachomatis]|nr:Uncharacterised protein [Chlamydia trachomatis]